MKIVEQSAVLYAQKVLNMLEKWNHDLGLDKAITIHDLEEAFKAGANFKLGSLGVVKHTCWPGMPWLQAQCDACQHSNKP